MKRLFALLLLVGLGTATFAQSKTVEEFRSKYKDDRDATSVSLNGSLFQLLGTIVSFDDSGGEEAEVIARLAKNIQSMDILAIPLYKSGFDPESVEEMRSNLKKEKYDELMTVKEGSDRMYFMAKGTNSEIKNMLVLIREEDEFVLLTIHGTLEMKDLAYLAKHHKDWN